MPQQILPSVFDRLFHPLHEGEKNQHNANALFCEAVRRDVEQLLNTRCAAIPGDLPCVRKSVVGYGMDSGIDHLSPQHLATSDGQQRLLQQLTCTIARFEPRLRNVSIVLFDNRLFDNRSSQRLRFRIEANLLMNSLLERISFDSILQPATGTLSVIRTAP
jgi:type VI secretion system lysozyme-like protein